MPGCSLLDFQKCAITCKTILVLCIPKPLLFQRPSSKIMYISTRRRRLMRGWKRGLGERQWWVQPHGGLHAPSPAVDSLATCQDPAAATNFQMTSCFPKITVIHHSVCPLDPSATAIWSRLLNPDRFLIVMFCAPCSTT